jgi:2,3-bisphosphoglycerate-independent phosphoglycerate mutase
LEAANTPNFDLMAKEGIVGLVKTIPEELSPGSDVANLSILGYDPHIYYSGRASLEAISKGINLREDEMAFRCNLVTIEDEIMVDYSAGHISSLEAEEFIEFLNQRMGRENLRFYPGVSYRNLMITSLIPVESLINIKCTPPHDIMGKKITEYLPLGPHNEIIREIMFNSSNILKENSLNLNKKLKGEREVSMVWLWGPGILPDMPKFNSMHSINGANISAVDLIKGISKCAGFEVIDVPGATGFYDTDYAAKGNYALSALEKFDLVYIHVEAPDEASHNGDIKEKIKAIEEIDGKIVKPILEEIKKYKEYKILLITDHYTPIVLRTHSKEPVPFALYSSEGVRNEIEKFTEEAAKASNIYFEPGYKITSWFLRR